MQHIVSCDVKVCGSSEIQVASVNPQLGKAVDDWETLPKDNLSYKVQEAVKTNLEKGFTFLFLRCGYIYQALSFPPILEENENAKGRSAINVNIIMLDSVSRPHFYRIMPKATKALPKIKEDSTIMATFLDFELVQSIGQQTFENLRPFFSGVLKDDNEVIASASNKKAPLGVEVLYGAFKKWGYQTLFQEDLCWYDIWGTALTDNERRKVPETNSDYKQRMKEFQEQMTKKMVDHFGITHFSCTVLNRIGRTNHYDSPQKVCLNGQFYSWYFFDYIRKVYTALENNRKAKPLLSYMHFNTGHEMTGTRMINMDAGMAKFLTDMALFPDTLTVIFSDHGHKMTPFSYTEEGRRELFDPVFFMIIPDGVKEKLGRERMGALVTNQKRIFMLYDVHNAFMSLHDSQNKDSSNHLVSGIFSEIPANRTCAHLYMLPLTRCKCEGFDEAIPVKDNADDHIWLAEFAVGYINDAIQKQYMDGNGDAKNKYGYGNCQRLVGKSFEKIIKRFRGEYILTTMDIHVVPPVGLTEDEVYKVSLKQFAKPQQGVFFLSSVRVTMYNKFASCVDKSVDIKLCLCAKEQTTDANKKEIFFQNGIPRKMFGSDTTVRDLDSNCLLFLRRNYGSFSFGLEVANVCPNRTYTFKLTGSMDQRIFSKSLPVGLELFPKTFHFLTSVYKYLSKVNDPLELKASVRVKKDGTNTFTNLGIFSVT
ncbi:uncharacterized protein LOC111345563 [Stylophora pistillata]|nr:uncharacterized protein LOC111345563 [Stylophora pistillata]